MNTNSEYIKCYLAEIGHNNFWYPTPTRALILLNCDYTKLPWISGCQRNLTAIKVLKSCVLPIDSDRRKTIKTRDASDMNDNDYTVVWIDK